jgi:hypothetical protein
MNVLPFHPNPRLLAMLEGFYLGAAALAIGFAFRRAVDRYLDEGDPRRQLIAQALLYGGTFVVIALSLLLRRRGS